MTEALRRSLQNIQRLIELVPMATALEDILDTTVEDTCTWLRTTPEILPLLTDSSNDTCTTTWIYGLPGCGKTYMAAYLTKLLQSKGPVGYFFCSKDERAVKDSAGVLRSWIWQLLQNHRSAAPDIENVLSNSTEVTKGTLKKALIMLLKNTSIPRCRLVLDGLDEYESKLRNDLLRTIEEIAPQVDIVILSRKEADIEKVMTSLSRIVHVERLEVTTEKTDADVLRFVQARVSNLDLEDDVVGQEIINTLHTRTQSMFLYAHLSIQELEGRDTDHERLQALRAMPSGIDAIYQRALTEIEKLSPARRDNIHKLCQLVLFAAKPVDVLEASVALAVRSGDAKLDPGNMISIKNLVTKFCSTFFAIHPKTGKISVVHETARAFLLSDSARRLQVQQQEAHNFILSACANFLALQSRGFVDRNISQDSDPDWNPFQHHASKHTFLEYASVCWFHHFLEVTGFWNIYLEKPVGAEESLRVSGLTMHTAEALTQFLASDTALIQWLEILHHFVCNGMPLASHVNDPLSDWIEYGQTKTITVGALLSADSQRNGEDMHPESIRLSLAFRLTSFISHLGRCNGHGIQRWLRWRNRERHIRPPIFIAASFNFDHFIKKQLDEGEDVNCRSVMDRTPLGLAAWMECHEAMEALIQRGADVSHCPAPDKITPLLESLSPLAFANLPRSYYRAAHILIEGGADVDNGLNPLQALIGGWTDMPEQFAILDAILDHSKDLRKLLETCDSRSGKHVLHLAAAKNEARLVKHLLERYPGTSCEYIDLPSAPGFDGKTALHEACYTRHSEVASILLDAGANPNIKAIQPVLAPIHIATRYRSDSLPLLLEHGADVDATDGVGSTTLHVAVDSDWLQGLEMLLQKGGQVNIINDQQETPLDAALRLKREDIVAALERKGARRACDVMKVHSWIMANVHIFNH